MSLGELNSALEKFETISLKELDKVKLMNRVETKFVFNATQLPELLKSILHDYKIVKIEDHLIHAYESFYFDDKDHFFFQEHHRGRKSRFKVRFRRYVESNLLFFEVKHKKKGRTNKRRVEVENYSPQLGIDEMGLLKMMSVPKTNLVPSLTNSYKRITLVNKKKIERLTLDIDLSFSFNSQEKSFPDIVIAELKQERISRTSAFYLAARKMRLRPFSISKYCTGLIQLNKSKDLKNNRFKKKLIHLNKLSNYGVHVV